MKRFAFINILVIGLWLINSANPATAATLPNRYPRLANYYLTRTLGTSQINELASWDIVILGLDNQYTNPQVFAQLRQKNPQIIILAYVLSEEFPAGYDQITDPAYPLVKLRSGIADSWWLRSAAGQKTGFWPGAQMLNVTNGAPLVNGLRWNSYLPQFVHDHVMSTGLWDGIFYDNVFNDVSWVNNGDLDLNNDGQAESATNSDVAWRDGMRAIMDRSRELEGNDRIIIGNGGGLYYPEMNGRLIEEFPSTLDGGWSGAMTKYMDVLQRGLTPSVVIVNGKSSTGSATDYQTMRYVLTSTLLGNGFFSFDEGQVRHMALWKYDEYDAYLGLPLNTARKVDSTAATGYPTGIWRRDFENGIVLVNSTDTAQTIKLGDGYEELRGAQSSVNGGKVITELTLAAHDGRMLWKRQTIVDNGSYTNGALVKLFKPDGALTRNGFFSYQKSQPGGTALLVKDLDNDGQAETVTANNGKIEVFNYRQEKITSWRPFRGYTGTLSIAAADLNQDGRMEFAVAPQGGKNQRVAGFTLRGRQIIKPFRAYKNDYPGGISLAAADVNGDNQIEIITGSGQKSDPRVSVFTTKARKIASWLAYSKNVRSGVRVAAGDLDNDGRAEIVTVPGPTGGPHVRTFTMTGKPTSAGFFALPKSYRQGLYVSVDDVDHNGQNRIIISTPVIY